MKFQQETADSCSKPDGTEEVKEIIPLSHEHRGCRNDTDSRQKQRWSQTRGLRLKGEGLQKTAQTTMLVNKQGLCQEK